MASKTKIKYLKLVIFVLFLTLLAGAFWRTGTRAQMSESNPAPSATATPAASPTAAAPAPAESPAAKAPPMEGCLKCHGNIEPMHKFSNQGDVLETLADGKDAQGLTCTACHGGNPATTVQKEAHVQPRYPKEWGCKDGDCSSRNPERSNTLIAKESREFVRFINPGDFRVIAQSCGECHNSHNKK